MKRIHPNASYTAALAALAAIATLSGCRNPSGGIANPFLAPDRVPPPATRALAPGQAQPYYPGDPLPVMQSGTPQPAGSSVATAEAQAMPSANTNLAWNSPSRNVQPASAATAAPLPMNSAPASRSVAASAEPTVAIPADGDSLRFELPGPPEPEPFTPIAPAPIPASQQPVQLAATPMNAAAPPTSGVVPASYSEPVIAAAEPAPNPWRSPEFNAIGAAATIPPPPATMLSQSQPSAPAVMNWPATPPPTMVANNIDVQLRAVPSPPPDGMSPTAPRIRLPGYMPSPPMVGSNDGFRPRSSMR